MKPGFLGNLGRRLGTAAVALPLLGLALFQGPAWLIVAIVAAALVAGLVEYFGMLAAQGIEPWRRTGLVLAGSMFLDVAWPDWHGSPGWPLAALLLLTVALLKGADLPRSVPGAAFTLLGAVYLGALGGTIAALRVLAPAGQGAWRILLLLAIVMASDTAAFFAGNAWGRRRLAAYHSGPGRRSLTLCAGRGRREYPDAIPDRRAVR